MRSGGQTGGAGDDDAGGEADTWRQEPEQQPHATRPLFHWEGAYCTVRIQPFVDLLYGDLTSHDLDITSGNMLHGAQPRPHIILIKFPLFGPRLLVAIIIRLWLWADRAAAGAPRDRRTPYLYLGFPDRQRQPLGSQASK